MTALATALLAWWALAPWATLATGWRRGHPLAGWRCGLVPLIGPALALCLPRRTSAWSIWAA